MAAEQYYCRRCCVEFHGAPGAWRLYAVDEEGNLVAAAPDPVTDEDLPSADPAAAAGGAP